VRKTNAFLRTKRVKRSQRRHVFTGGVSMFFAKEGALGSLAAPKRDKFNQTAARLCQPRLIDRLNALYIDHAFIAFRVET
jgi:hypothetical protein